jgi:hypothetical protein
MCVCGCVCLYDMCVYMPDASVLMVALAALARVFIVGLLLLSLPTDAYVSIRQHPSASVSIRQHTPTSAVLTH